MFLEAGRSKILVLTFAQYLMKTLLLPHNLVEGIE
jgi:hypothetical protein